MKIPNNEVRTSLYRGYMSRLIGVDFALDFFRQRAKKTAQELVAALAQCREKRYADAYQSDGRRVVYVGVNYDPATRTIGDVKCENAL